MRKKKPEKHKWYDEWYKDEGLFFFLSTVSGAVFAIIFWFKDKFFS